MQRLVSSARVLLPRAHQAASVYELQYAGAGGVARRWFAAGVEDDSHDDFKPKVKGSAASSVKDQIERDISAHGVFIYMKGIPQAPMCGFSNMACRILDAYEVEYGSANVLADEALREGIKQFTHWPTIPQIFIKGEFVGGSDILYDLHQKGELGPMLADASKAEEGK